MNTVSLQNTFAEDLYSSPKVLVSSDSMEKEEMGARLLCPDSRCRKMSWRASDNGRKIHNGDFIFSPRFIIAFGSR